MPVPLFHSDGPRLVPTEHTRGPWDARAQHGGPPGALVARAMEALPSDAPMMVARLTLEILRPVPLAPLEVEARVERPGRRVQLVSATVSSAGVELCRATGWRIRRLQAPMPLPAALPRAVEAIAGPELGSSEAADGTEPAFHRSGVELRFVRGGFYERGPCTVWIRLRRAVVDDEIPSPLMRVVAAADFGNGVSAELDWTQSLFINTDLTVYLDRDLDGEWVCMDSRTLIDPHGVGLAESALYDPQGRIGRSLQALLVEPAREVPA